jgi:hypothetical protein
VVPRAGALVWRCRYRARTAHAGSPAAVLDPVTKTLIDTARFADTGEGYARLAGFARRWGCRRWAVEGCRGTGRSLAQRLVADGVRGG